MTRTEPELWQIAEQVLTDKQLEACRLVWQRQLTVGQAAAILQIDRSAVRDRLRSATRNLATALRKDAA